MKFFRRSVWLLPFFVCNIILSCDTQESLKLLHHYAKKSYDGDLYCLLSYPRSGNTLVRYMFEFVTGQPTIELISRHGALNLPLASSFKELNVDMYAKPMWKMHRNRAITAQHFYDPQRVQVAFLLRNYKEIVLRYSEFRKLPLFDEQAILIEAHLAKAFSIWDQDDSRELYFKNIEFFESIPEDKRLLIYYEDLISNPYKEIDRLTSFFNGSWERADLLKREYAYYKGRIHNFYNVHESVRSQVNDLRYYSKKYTYAQCIQIDEWVKAHHMDLWERHLSHYDERLYRVE